MTTLEPVAAPTSFPAPRISLLEHRLVIVSGKGGTGKTTVAAALGLAAARSGRRVLIAEVGRSEQIPGLLSDDPSPAGYAGRELRPGLVSMRVDPFEALAEYLGLQLRARSLVDVAVRNKGFRQLMEAAPGWRELITLGKVWHLEQQQDASGRALYDLIVVDAPATGHGVTFLDVPRVVGSAVRAGPLRDHAHLVEEMIHDDERSLLLPVALAEELPARETAELVGRVRADVGIAVDRVVVNAVASPPFPAGLEDLDARLQALPEGRRFGALPSGPELAACAATLRARYELNQTWLREIEARCALPVVALPQVVGGIRGADELRPLGEALLASDPGGAPR